MAWAGAGALKCGCLRGGCARRAGAGEGERAAAAARANRVRRVRARAERRSRAAGNAARTQPNCHALCVPRGGRQGRRVGHAGVISRCRVQRRHRAGAAECRAGRRVAPRRSGNKNGWCVSFGHAVQGAARLTVSPGDVKRRLERALRHTAAAPLTPTSPYIAARLRRATCLLPLGEASAYAARAHPCRVATRAPLVGRTGN